MYPEQTLVPGIHVLDVNATMDGRDKPGLTAEMVGA
jgi:hypothetical protein